MATGVDFVCFQSPLTVGHISLVNKNLKAYLPYGTMIKYGEVSNGYDTVASNPVISKVIYTSNLGVVAKYVCVFSYYGLHYIGAAHRDNTNWCAFTDSKYGKDTSFNAAAETFIGQSIYSITNSNDDCFDTGLKVTSVHGAACNCAIYINGVYKKEVSATIANKNNGEFYNNYAMGITGAAYSVNLPTQTNCTLTSVTGNIGKQNGSVWEFDATQDLALNCYFGANYTIVFSANGGTGEMSAQSFVGTVEQKLSKNTLTNNQFVFMGWNTASNGSGKTYADEADGSSILSDVGGSAGATITLYAQWRKPTVYIANTDANKGLLKLYRLPVLSTNLIATEKDGVLGAEVTEGTYIVVCEQKDALYYGRGLGPSESEIDYSANTDTTGRNITRFEISDNTMDLKFYYTKRATYSIDFAVTPTGAGAAILQKQTNGVWPTSYSEASSADEVVSGVSKWLPQMFRFFVAPSEGYNFTSLHVVDAVDGSSSQPSLTNPPVSPNYYACNLTGMDDNLRVDLVFEKKKFNVGVEVDDASEAFGAVTVSAGGTSSETGLSNVEYGSSVTFTAALKSGVSASDYKFEGWYINNARVSASVSYTYTVTSAVTAIAKFAARTRLGIVFEDNREDKTAAITQSATLQVGGVAVENNVYDAFIVLGRRVDFVLTPGSFGEGLGNWSFNAWYDVTDTTYQAPYEYSRTDGFVIAKSTNLIARLTVLKIECKLIVKVHINNPATEVAPDLTNPVITSTITPTSESDGYAFTLDGSGLLSLTANNSIVYNGKSYAFNGWATGVPSSTGYSILSYNITYTKYLTERSRTIYALYGEPMDIEISASYIGGCNRTMGTLMIGEESNETTGLDSVSATAKQGTTITLSAKSKNGYRFAGWYLSKDATGEVVYSTATIQLNVVGTQIFYAAFVRDTNAIYEWEGSDANKMFEWKSKVYVAPKPFNPSALRVDTEGYLVGEVRVGMFSSPDSTETAVSTLTNVASQSPRRLPKRRPERYIQVTFKNDHEVDSAVISTSMGGLAV